MYESTWVHTRGFDLDLAVLRIHTINTFSSTAIYWTYISHNSWFLMSMKLYMWSTCNKLHEGLPWYIEEVSPRYPKPTLCCILNVADWMTWVTTCLVYFIMLPRVLDIVGRGIIEGSLFWHKTIVFPSNLPCVMLTFVRNHLYPMWKLYSSTCKDEIGSPLKYVHMLVPSNSRLLCGKGTMCWACVLWPN